MTPLRDAFNYGFFTPCDPCRPEMLDYKLTSVLDGHDKINCLCNFRETTNNLNRLGIDMSRETFSEAYHTGFNTNDETRRLKALIEQALSEDKKEVDLDDFT